MLKIAEVIVDVAHSQVDRVFDYYINEGVDLKPGHRVLVSFNNRNIEGFVVNIKNETQVPKNKMKSIIKLMEEYPALTVNQLKLARWMKQEYSCLLVDSLRVMLPAQMRGGRIKEKHERYAKINFDISHKEEVIKSLKGKKQIAIIEYLLNCHEAVKLSEINDTLGNSASSINSLAEKQLIIITNKRVYRQPKASLDSQEDKKVILSSAQQFAINEILNEKANNKEYILHGVTGSGKTEVYMQVSAKIIKKNKSVIILVPEISLTPQIVAIFQARFKENAAVLHSKLSAGERFDEWQRIRHGQAKIVIGARSAVFAPVQSLGLIVVDEEHETTYKSEYQPRYDAIEVAKKRCLQDDCALVLGSATPTISRYYKTIKGEYNLLELPKRVGNALMPSTSIVDMREEFKKGNTSIISQKLKDEIEYCLNNSQKIILFLNRRGHSTHVSCRDCGYVVQCEYCDVSMTYHMFDGVLRCHYCGREQNSPSTCPQCGSKYIKFFGGGTEKVQEEVERLFPGVKVLRMDADTTGKKNSHVDILNAFAKEDGQVLVGTQMIAKGLDFHDVTLVGVIAADISLYASDYRAVERTFQLTAQVSGRAGRGALAGKVVIQTYSPDNYAIVYAANHDYKGFYKEEIALRKIANYPPFAYFSRWIFSSEDEQAAQYEADKAYDNMKKIIDNNIDIRNNILSLDVSPTRLMKIKGRYRYQLLIKYYPDGFGKITMKHFANLKGSGVELAHMTLEIDPMNMI